MSVEQDKKTKSPETKALKKRVQLAEARKAEIELARAELGLELEQIRAGQYKHEAKLKANGDSSHGVFSLETSVRGNVVALAAEIRQFTRTYPKAPVTLNLFSPGGSIMDGLVLYDTLRAVSKQGHTVTTVARGYAASMAAILFLAGDVRLMGPEAEIMFHSLSAGGGGSLHELEDDLKFYKKLQGKLDGIITGRTKISAELLVAKTKKKDWWCDSKQALKLKVAHGTL